MAVFKADDEQGVGTSMFFLRYLLETIAEIKHENDSLSPNSPSNLAFSYL